MLAGWVVSCRRGVSKVEKLEFWGVSDFGFADRRGFFFSPGATSGVIGMALPPHETQDVVLHPGTIPQVRPYI